MAGRAFCPATIGWLVNIIPGYNTFPSPHKAAKNYIMLFGGDYIRLHGVRGGGTLGSDVTLNLVGVFVIV